MAHYTSRVAPGVREDPQLIRESVESSRAMQPPGSGGGSRPSTRGSSADDTGDWVLDPITHEGRSYLLDRRTGAVYTDTPEDQYPELVGRWQNGQVVLRQRNVVVDLFAGLDKYLKEHKVRFKDLFDSYDTDRSGTLEIRELALLVKELVPGVTVAELKYIMAMLDSSGDGHISQEEFLASAKASLEAARAAQQQRQAGAGGAAAAGTGAVGVREVLQRVTQYLRTSRVDAKTLFRQFDKDGSGRLEPPELSRFFQAAVPGLQENQLRYLMAHMYELDANGDGTVSFRELLNALNAVGMQRGGAGAEPAAQPAPISRQMSIASQPGGSEWVLQDVFDPNSSRYLKLDPATGLVYAEVTPGEWPQVVGGQDAGGVLRLMQRREDGGLFAALDAYLKSHKVKFKALFDTADADRSGFLDMAELRELVRTILPNFTDGQVHYFQALLDINGDGRIDFDEMMAVAKECMAVEKAAAAGMRDPNMKIGLDKLQKYLLHYSSAAYQHFEAADVSRRGHLRLYEFARFVQRLMPDLTEPQRRAILSYLYAQDIDQSGVISWQMLCRFMRVPQLSQLAAAAAPPAALQSENSAGRLRRGASGASPARVTFDNTKWELQEMEWRGEVYLLDPQTRRVYKEKADGGWPQLVGVLAADGRSVELSAHSTAAPLFEALDAYLKEHRMRCREVFDAFDADKKGYLTPSELGKLVKHFLQDKATVGSVKYLQVMIDRNQDGQITYEEFLEAAKTCRQEEEAARARDPEARKALQAVSDYMRSADAEVRTEFNRFDTNRNGMLEPRELAQLLRTVLPNMGEQQLRIVLAHLQAYDVDGDGGLSFREFCIAMRAVTAEKKMRSGREEVIRGDFLRSKSIAAPGRGQAHAHQAPRPKTPPDDTSTEWILQELNYSGKRLLLDPRTQRVYRSADGVSWPALVGRLDPDGTWVKAAPNVRPAELFQRLDAYLKQNKVKLRELFMMYDVDGSGGLAPSDLSKLCRDIMPDVTRAELHYFLAMMDANGDGQVTYEEFISAAQEALRTTQQTTGAGSASATPTMSPEAIDALERLSIALAGDPNNAKRRFHAVDKNGNGALDMPELARFLRAFQPELAGRQLHYVLSYLACLDLDGDGQLSFSELMQALQALTARGPGGVTYTRAFRPGGQPGESIRRSTSDNRMVHKEGTQTLLRSTSMNRDAYTPNWELHEWRFRGVTYLLDPQTNLVYADPTSAQQWPELVGRKVGEAFQPVDTSGTITFFKNLDTYLRSEQVRFGELFAEFDRGRKGYLTRDELGALVQRVMPEVTSAQQRFFAMVLDENNDKVFEQAEILGAAKKVVELLRRHGGGAGGAAGPPPEVAAALERVSHTIRGNMERCRTYFTQLDDRRRGSLTYDQVAVFFRGLVRDLTQEELRYLLAQVHLYDVDGVGEVTFTEMLRAMRAADLTSARHGAHTKGWVVNMAAKPGARAAPRYDTPSTWRLEPLRWGNSDVLLDPATRVVYTFPTEEGGWPQPIGKLGSRQGEVVQPPNDAYQFFKRLDQYLKSARVRLRQVFDEADVDRSGALDGPELRRLLQRVMPDASKAQLNYFQAMMDVDGSHRLSYEQLVDVCRQGLAAETAAGSDRSDAAAGLAPEVAEALRMLSHQLARDPTAAGRLFQSLDRDGSGRLEPRELAGLLRRLRPELQPAEMRHLIANLFRAMDHDGDGTISFQEFMFAMRAVELQAPGKTYRPGAWVAASRSAAPAPAARARTPVREPVMSSLDLEEVEVLRSRYLWSRANNVVYEPPPQPMRSYGANPPPFPKALGTLDRQRGSVVQSAGGASSGDLFTALDNYLRTAKVRFNELFARYDRDRSGKLEPRELGQLVADLLGPQAAHPADVAYFVALLDLDGSSGVTEQEFLAVAKEFLSLQRRTADAQGDDVRKALDKASTYLRADKEGANELFLRHDRDGDGRLALSEVVKFMADLLRGQLAQRELHYLLTQAHNSDVAKAGNLTFNDLLVAFRAIPVRFPGGVTRPPGFTWAAATAAVAAPPSLAQLEAFSHNNKVYYRDPETGYVYSLVDDRHGPRLELVFRARPGASRGAAQQVQRPVYDVSNDLFGALDAALKDNRMRLRELFDRYDANRNGRLEASELRRLVADLLPRATEADLRYFQAMLDYDGDMRVSYEELVAAIKECWGVGKAVANRESPELEAALARIAAYLRGQAVPARAVFERFDRNGTGRLESPELARFLRACMPQLSSAELRQLMAHLHFLDTNGDGAISFNELLHGLGALELQLPDGRKLAARYVARAPSATAASGAAASAYRGSSSTSRPYPTVQEWRLEAWHCGPEGRDYWLDRETGLVYAPATSREEGWPVLMGAKARDGSVQRMGDTISSRFFDALDGALRSERMRLEDLLRGYDRDSNAGLDLRELGRLAKDLLGEEMPQQHIRFLMALLDIDGDRLVSKDEVMQVFQQMNGTAGRVAGLQDPAAVALLNDLSAAVAANMRGTWDRFVAADVNNNNALDPSEVKRFLQSLLPRLSPADLRQALSYLHLLDVNGNGRLEFKELLVALRVVPVRTPSGVLRPPAPPFRVRRASEAAAGHRRSSEGGGGTYRTTSADGRGSRTGEGGYPHRSASGRARPQSSDDEPAYDSRRSAVAAIPDREFTMELRASSNKRRDLLRDEETRFTGAHQQAGPTRPSVAPDPIKPSSSAKLYGMPLSRPNYRRLQYTPPPSGAKAAWPQLATYESRDGSKRPLVPLPQWPLLLDLEAAVQQDPDRLLDAAKRKARGKDEAIDARTAASLLQRAASSSSASRGDSDAALDEALLKGMLEVLHVRDVKARKLLRDVEALAGAYRLLTDGKDGVAMLRDAAASLSREYRTVVRAMRKYASSDQSSHSGGPRLKLVDVCSVLQDTVPEVMGPKDNALALMLYVLYNCPHCLAAASSSAPVALGWKDVFKALRAVKCKFPEGTARVGHWDAAELLATTRRSSGSDSGSASSDSSYSRDEAPRARHHHHHHNSTGGSSRHGHRSHRRSGGSSQPPLYPYPRAPGYSGGGAQPYEAFDRYGRPIAPPPPPPYNPLSAYGYVPPDPRLLEELAKAALSTSLSSRSTAAPPHAAAAYEYLPAKATAVGAASDSAAVRRRMAHDLQMVKNIPSAKKLSLQEEARRKVHPQRRVVQLVPYTSGDGKNYAMDQETGLVYVLSQREEYPDLIGKVRPSGDMQLAAGGSSATLQGVFDTLRRLDEAVLVKLFKAYDSNNNGTLELKELMHLLREITNLPYAEAGLVQAMLDVDMSNSLSLKEFVEGLRASTDCLDALGRAQRQAVIVLAAVSAQIAADLEVFWAAYARADRDGNGYLDVSELARFFRDLFRNMPPYDLRLLVAYCFTTDVERDGLVRPDELLQHLRAVPLQSPTGVKHKPGFVVPAATTRSALMDSFSSAKSNAHFNYSRPMPLSTEPSDLNDSLAARLPSGQGFPGSGGGGLHKQGMNTAQQAMAAAMAGGMPQYIPVPVPMPMYAPGPAMAPAAAGAGGGQVMGYLLPYQQDMYQALYDRLGTRSPGHASGSNTRGTTPRVSGDGSVYSSGEEEQYAEQRQQQPYPQQQYQQQAQQEYPPPPLQQQPSGHYPPMNQPTVTSPTPSVIYTDRGEAIVPPSSRSHVPYVEPPPPVGPQPMQPSGPRYAAPTAAQAPPDAYGYQAPPPQQPYGYGYPPQSETSALAPYGNGQQPGPPARGAFGLMMELQRTITSHPQALHAAFMPLARAIPSGRRHTYNNSGGYSPGGNNVHVVPRATLVQLMQRLRPGTREGEARYVVDIVTAALPYNTASYSKDDITYAVRQGAAIERQVEERRLPPEASALLARLAEDVTGLGGRGRGAAQQAFRDADRYRRGSLPLAEQVRLLQRLSQAPPSSTMWLLVALHHYAATALGGAGDMTFEELSHALGQLAAAAVAAPQQQQPYGAPAPSPYGSAAPYGQPGYGAQPSPYGSYDQARSAPYQDPYAPSPYPGAPPSHAPSYSSQPSSSYGGGYPPQGPQVYLQGGYSPSPNYSAPSGAPYGSSQYDAYTSPPGSPRPGLYSGPSAAPAYNTYPNAYGPYPPGADPLGSMTAHAYYAWTHDNRQAVLERHISELMKGRAKELEVQAVALYKEDTLKKTIFDTTLALQKSEAAHAEVLNLIQTYNGNGAPPVNVQDIVAKISSTLDDAIHLARNSAAAGGTMPPGPHPTDFDGLLDSLTNAKWVSGQPVSMDTLRAALALRRDAYELQRLHGTRMAELDKQHKTVEVANHEVQHAMAIQLQLLQAQLQRQAQEFQARLLAEAQAQAPAVAAAGGGNGSSNGQQLAGLMLPPAHFGTAAVIGLPGAAAGGGGLLLPLGAASGSMQMTSLARAAAAAAGVPGSFAALGASASPPRMVVSPRTWQLEPEGSASIGGGAQRLLYRAPTRD